MGAGHNRSRAPIVVAVAMSAAALVLGGPAAGAPADGADPAQQPGLSHASAKRFFLETLQEKLRGEWGRAWQSLYPLHQRIAPRDAFVRCEEQMPFSAPLDSLRVIDVVTAAVSVPGLRHTVPGAAIGVEVALRWYGPRDPIVFRHTFHVAAVRGRWTWLLSPSRYRLYRSGACGGSRTAAAAGRSRVNRTPA